MDNKKTCAAKAAAELLRVSVRTVQRWDSGRGAPKGWPGLVDFNRLRAWAIETGRVDAFRVLSGRSDDAPAADPDARSAASTSGGADRDAGGEDDGDCPRRIAQRAERYLQYIEQQQRAVKYFNASDELLRRELAMTLARIELMEVDEAQAMTDEAAAYTRLRGEGAAQECGIGGGDEADGEEEGASPAKAAAARLYRLEMLWKAAAARLRDVRVDLKAARARRDEMEHRCMLNPFQRRKGDTAGRHKKDATQNTADPLAALVSKYGMGG